MGTGHKEGGKFHPHNNSKNGISSKSFTKTLNLTNREHPVTMSITYDDNKMSISIDEEGYSNFAEGIVHVPIFEGNVSLTTDLDTSGKISTPDWVKVKSDRYGKIQNHLDDVDKDWVDNP